VTKVVRYISTSEAIALHILLMRQWQEVRFGIERNDLLESALNRPRQAANFDDANIHEQAATLCFGLIKNHPWYGGNKRTATLITEVFLESNGYELLLSNDEIVGLALDTDLDRLEVMDISKLFRSRSRKLVR